MATQKKTKQGSVYVETSKGVFPFDMLRKAEIKPAKKTSQQLASVQKWMTLNNLIPPPYPPMALLNLYESNSVFWRCVNQLAIDVAGLGWSLAIQPDKKDNAAELKRINDFLIRPNPDDSFRAILKRLLIDWGSVGWFGMEVAKNNKGDIVDIYHIPAHTLKVHKSKKKYAQIRNNKKAWFKKFGEPKNISSKTGEEIKGRGRNKANELIFYKNYYPKSDYYGVPNIISAIGDVVGLIGLRDYNLAFFENFGVPAALIVLEGDWEEGSQKAVSDFLNKELKGTDNAHKTLVVEQPDNCKFQYHKLSVDVKEGSFKLYEKARQEDILIAYSMPPERIGIRVVGKLGGNVAEEATKVYVQSVVEPLQLDMEDLINNKLLQSEIYRFKFNDIDTRDLKELVDRLGYEIERGMTSPNEARNELGRKPYQQGDKFYIMSSLIPVGEPNSEDALSKVEQEFLDENVDSPEFDKE